MEVIIANLVFIGLVVAAVISGAPTWAWIAIMSACLVGNIAGAIAKDR